MIEEILRDLHRAVISGLLILWVAFVIGYVVVLVQGGTNLDRQVVQWRGPLIVKQAMIGGLMIVAVWAWLTRHEERGLKFAISGFLLSLVALQTLYFYLSQFSAITVTLLQLAFLQILFAYRRWYLRDHTRGDVTALSVSARLKSEQVQPRQEGQS